MYEAVDISVGTVYMRPNQTFLCLIDVYNFKVVYRSRQFLAFFYTKGLKNHGEWEG